jgi:transcriptional regulator with XRE-family HTH domain
MTKEEFRAARLSLGLSQAELAKALGKSSRMIVHYEAGTVKVPKSVKLMMDKILKENGNDRLHNSQ